MYEHVGLRSKVYASRSENNLTDLRDDGLLKKSKGVKKSVVENEITFQDYKECLFDKTTLPYCETPNCQDDL